MNRWILAAILLAAATLRIGLNNVTAYSPADETVYASYTKTLMERGFVQGYPEIVRAFVEQPRRWKYPSPLRWGYFLLTTFAAETYGSSDPRAIAWLSTIAGLLVVPIVFFLGRRLFNERTALLAAAFTAVSPIELALGRRALQDEVFCLAVVASLALVVVALEKYRWPWIAGAIAALTLAFAVKESFLYLYPAFLVLPFLYKKPRALALFIAPPALYFLGFAALARSPLHFFRIGRIITSAMTEPYVLQYQGGPPHRLLFDFLIASPLVAILAGAAVVSVALARDRGRSETVLVAFLVIGIAIFAVVPSKNLRFYVMFDPVIRLLAAWIVARTLRTSTLVAVAACNVAIDVEIFRATFIDGGVYDPVTQSLLEAVGAVPHDIAPHPMMFPWVCGAIIVSTWLYQSLTPATIRTSASVSRATASSARPSASAPSR